jgi:chemotaxis protein methyltransferase CheR
MEPSLFRAFREIAARQAGLQFGDAKLALVTARVAKRIRALGLKDHRTYLDFLKQDETGSELVHFLDVVTTNHTAFMRESEHFTLLHTYIRERMDEGQRRFRVWSAACSTGEEPYTVAMTLADCAGAVPVDTRILATDISTRVLEKARHAHYAASRLEPLPRAWTQRYFAATDTVDREEQLLQVRREIREKVHFSRLNLSQPPFPMSGPFDVIFCRNVMIYFGADVRRALLRELERLLRPGGYLLIGHAETLTGLATDLRVVKPSIYLKGDGA